MINVIKRYEKYGQIACHIIHYDHPIDPMFIVLGMDNDKLVDVGTAKTQAEAESMAVDFINKI